MFDINGGMLNIALAMINIITLIMLVVMPYVFGTFIHDRSKLLGASLSLIGFFIYCFIIYVANPGLTFWKVV